MGMYIQDDYWEAAEDLAPEEQAEFFRAVITYHFTGEVIPLTGMAAFGFKLVRDRIDRAKAAAARSAENGRRGGRPRRKDGGDEASRVAGAQNQEQAQRVMRARNPEQTQQVMSAQNPDETDSIKSESESESEKDLRPNESPSGDSCRAGARRKASAEDVGRIIDHLNERTGKAFRASSKATRRRIDARFAEGYTVGDFIRVIDAKAAEWAGVVTRDGRSMDEYLCPETLFSEKFERYLQAAAPAAGGSPPKAYATGSAEGDEEVARWLRDTA